MAKRKPLQGRENLTASTYWST